MTGVQTCALPIFAMLVANASFVFEDAGSIQQEEDEGENIWHWMRRCAVCCYACGETGLEGKGRKEWVPYLRSDVMLGKWIKR